MENKPPRISRRRSSLSQVSAGAQQIRAFVNFFPHGLFIFPMVPEDVSTPASNMGVLPQR